MRTYDYGLLEPVFNGQVVDDQFFEAHKLKNRLIEIERARREKVDAIFAPYAAARTVAGRARPDEPPAKLVLSSEDLSLVEAASKDAYAAAKVAYNESGAIWGSRLAVMESVQRMAGALLKERGKPMPRFQRYVEVSHLISVQLQGGLPAGDLLAGTDTRARLTGAGRRRWLWFRVGSNDDRTPVWAIFQVVYHRPIPKTATVKWVRVCRRRVGTRYVYRAQFVLDGVGVEDAARLPVGRGVVGVDLGWRSFKDGSLRVATWADSTGGRGELRLPPRVRGRLTKVDDLRSIRDKNFAAARQQLVDARGGQRGWSVWLVEATEYAHAWKAPRRLAMTVCDWEKARFAGDESLFSKLKRWQVQDRHLLNWEANQRENVHRHRREIYRLFGLEMAKYEVVGIEKMDLRGFAELPATDEPKDTPIEKNARPNRFIAALSELRTCLRDTVARANGLIAELPPQYTTVACARCGFVGVTTDPARSVELTCGGCGTAWDQDANAAQNLLRAAQLWATSPERSKSEAANTTGESRAASRRAKALATRRAGRSKEA